MIAFAVLCGALGLGVIGFVLWPLLRRAPDAVDTGQFDRAVYRDQLAELDQDLARGVLPAHEAAAARLEIERRMLASARTAIAAGGRRSPAMAAGLAVLMIAGTSGLYLEMGRPLMAGQTPRATVPPPGDGGHTDVEKSVLALREKLDASPDNAERWMLYARTTATLGQWDRSIEGYRQVMRLVPNEPDVIAGYGEMLLMQADGIVTPDAHAAFDTVIGLRPKSDIARFYLALAAAQGGEMQRAIDQWLTLAKDAPEGSEMRAEIARRIAESAKLAGIAAPALPPGGPPLPPEPADAAAAPGGPNADEVAAAAQMAPAERDAMVHAMVDKLAAKLAAAPDDAEGWLKLGRAYLVLGDATKSAAAYDRAQALRPGDVSVKLAEAMAVIDGLDPAAPVPPRTIAALQAVQAADPARVEPYWYLGAAQARAGDKAGAEKNWSKLLTMLPKGEDRDMVEAALKGLK